MRESTNASESITECIAPAAANQCRQASMDSFQVVVLSVLYSSTCLLLIIDTGEHGHTPVRSRNTEDR